MNRKRNGLKLDLWVITVQSWTGELLRFKAGLVSYYGLKRCSFTNVDGIFMYFKNVDTTASHQLYLCFWYADSASTPWNVCAVRDLLGGASFVSLSGQHTFCWQNCDNQAVLCLFVCWSLTSLCHSNGHIETMPAWEINPFTALTRIRSQFLRTQWSTSNHSEWTRLRLRPLSRQAVLCKQKCLYMSYRAHLGWI